MVLPWDDDERELNALYETIGQLVVESRGRKHTYICSLVECSAAIMWATLFLTG